MSDSFIQYRGRANRPVNDLPYRTGVVDNAASRALGAEAAALEPVVAGLRPAYLARPSPCPPWTCGQLIAHLLVGADRIGPALAAAGPGTPAGLAKPLITATGYYRPDQRFSPDVNAARIDAAIELAAQLPAGADLSAELSRRLGTSLALLTAAPAGAAVITRHGDPMLLAEFAVTRVVELGLHGLDLAAGLGRPPWLTGAAADVLERLLLPAGNAGQLRERLRCDRAGLIAMLSGRAPVDAAAAAELAAAGAARLSFG